MRSSRKGNLLLRNTARARKSRERLFVLDISRLPDSQVEVGAVVPVEAVVAHHPDSDPVEVGAEAVRRPGSDQAAVVVVHHRHARLRKMPGLVLPL